MPDKLDITGRHPDSLLRDIRGLIEQGRRQAVAAVNSALTVTYWQVGRRINDEVLRGKRAEYGKQVVVSLADELVVHYGKSFAARNLRRMMQFAEVFPDFEMVSPLVAQLSWTHFIVLMSLPNPAARMFYIQHSVENNWSKRELQRQIDRKAFERAEIANHKLALAESGQLAGNFKDPYFLDFLGLKEGYLENELENALLKELELFILELGKGFAFVERQKRMIIDGEDFYLDLLFFHRKIRRLVAVELKINRFQAAYKGQMELYLNWLNRHERQEGEEAPIGLILCAEAGSEQVELLNMQKRQHPGGRILDEPATERAAGAKVAQRAHRSARTVGREETLRIEFRQWLNTPNPSPRPIVSSFWTDTPQIGNSMKATKARTPWSGS